MSEKYSSGIEYYESQLKEEWERDHVAWHWSLSESSHTSTHMEDEFYRQIPITQALQKAIEAVIHAIEKQTQKKESQNHESLSRLCK